MPFPYTQRLSAPLPCDEGIIMFELSATMFSSWAIAFNQYIRLNEHSLALAGFLTILQRALDINNPIVLETVVDKVDFWGINKGQLTSSLQPRSYRIWMPLTGAAASAFATELNSSLSSIDAPKEKRRRTDVPDTKHPLETKIQSKEDFCSLLRLYYGARTRISHITMEDSQDDEDTRNENHILNLLDARTYFSNASVIEKHSRQRLDTSQACIESYLRKDNESTMFMPSSKVRSGLLCRLINTGNGKGMLRNATDILKFMLPHYVPPHRLVLNKLRVVLDSVGESWDPKYNSLSIEELVHVTAGQTPGTLFTDPIDYSPIEVGSHESPEGIDFMSNAAAVQLQEAYPVSFRLKNTNIKRMSGARNISPDEVERVYESVIHEIQTLLTEHVDGVPLVYHDLMKESADALQTIQTDAVPPICKKMFFQNSNPRGGYTGFGYRMLRLLLGSSNCLRLMEQQSMLFLLLYARHFSVTANRAGIGGGLTLVCGPPDTGKSRACEQFLSCVAKTLHVQNDGQSEKAYTSGYKSTDLRCLFQDEIKDLLVGSSNASDAASSSGIKIQQTLLSRGYVRYKRLVQTSDGSYRAEDILVVQRVMTVGCTNAVSSIPPAIQSRACIVPVVKQPKDVVRRVSVNALVASRDNPSAMKLERSFMLSTQLLSALQGRFWQLECFGVIPEAIDTSVYTIFQSMLEQEHGRDLLPARRFLDIKETAEGLMVLDLISCWYSRGLGALYGYDTTKEAVFYASRAALRMEHVCTAFWLQISATSMNAHLSTVGQILKQLIKYEAEMPVKDESGDFFVLNTSTRNMAADVSQRLPHLGVGLVQQVINQIHKGITRGLPNIRHCVDNNKDCTMINAHYIATVVSVAERKILILLEKMSTRPEMCQISYDEKHFVFTSTIRQQINPSSRLGLRPELKDVPHQQLLKALTMLSYRYDKEDNPMWSTPQTCSIAQEVSQESPGAVESIRFPGKWKKEKTWMAPLIVHKDLLEDKNPKCTTIYDELINKALLIGGGYKDGSRVFIGAAPLGDKHALDHYITVKQEPVEITLDNPLYIPGGQHSMSDLLGDSDASDDPLWPRHSETVTFTDHSDLEEKIAQKRYYTLMGTSCPKNLLPSATMYM